MQGAQLQERTDTFVSYYDADSGVYLTWSTAAQDVFILSLDKTHVLGQLPTGATNVQEADGTIREWINDRTKAYGAEAGLWNEGS